MCTHILLVYAKSNVCGSGQVILTKSEVCGSELQAYEWGGAHVAPKSYDTSYLSCDEIWQAYIFKVLLKNVYLLLENLVQICQAVKLNLQQKIDRLLRLPKPEKLIENFGFLEHNYRIPYTIFLLITILLFIYYLLLFHKVCLKIRP